MFACSVLKRYWFPMLVHSEPRFKYPIHLDPMTFLCLRKQEVHTVVTL